MNAKHYEAHASCHSCGLLQTGPVTAMAALNKVAEKHTSLHKHTTTTGMRLREASHERTAD